MRARWVFFVCVLGLGLAVSSCKKIESEAAPAPAVFSLEPVKFQDAIPAEYGSLIAVTTDTTYSGWAQLWFEKPDKSIVVVRVSYISGTMHPKVMTIPRK